MDYTKELTRFEDYLGKRVSPGTVRVYLNALRDWFSTLNGGEPSPEAAQRFVDAQAVAKSASTVNIKAHAIMRWYKWKGKNVDLDCPTVRAPEPEYLNMDQFTVVIEACNTALEEAIIIPLFDTAVRISELLNLEINDIDWQSKTISVVRKGGRKEKVNISDKGLSALGKWLRVRNSQSRRVFMDLTYNDAWWLIKKVGKRAGIELHPHMLRHARAVQMLKSGATLHVVMMHLGHKNINTTASIYGRYTAADLKEDIPSW
jgi:integrase/recombinase XerD